MNRWLSFEDTVLEANYHSYMTKNMMKYPKILAYTLTSYGSLNILMTIIEHFISDCAYHKEIEWLLSRLITIIIGCIIFGFMIFISKKNSGKNFETLKFLLGFILQVSLDEDLFIQVNSCEAEAVRYYYFWESYQIQFYKIFVCVLFEKWTHRLFFFCFSSGYYCIMKIQSTYDILHILRESGYCLIFGLIMYYFESISRERFSELKILLDREIGWRKLLDHVPEDIMILDNNNNVKYKNIALFNVDKNEDKIEKVPFKSNLIFNRIKKEDEFISQINNLSLRDNIEELKIRDVTEMYARIDSRCSLKIDSQEDYFKYENDMINHLNNDNLTNIPIIMELKKRACTLKEVLNIINSPNKLPVDDNIYLTFDGFYGNRSIELRMVSTFFEGKKCLMMIILDTTQRDLIIKLEQNDKYKNMILSTVTHELRNPLNSSMSMLQLAVDNESISNKIKDELLHPSLRSLGILANLINDILDYSQIQANKLKLVFQYVDLRDLIYDVCLLVETQCYRKGLKLRVYIDPEIPEIFKTDPNRLTQILMNLLSNSLKFTKTGSIKISVKIKDKIQGLITIAVSDSGIGIKAEDIPNLFQEYCKLDLGKNANINVMGCGLGLNISQKLAKCLGKEGDIDCGIQIESQVLKGTSFWFTIHDKREKSDNPTNSFLELNDGLNNKKIKKNYEKFSSMNSMPISSNSLEVLLKKGRRFSNKLNRNIANKSSAEEDIRFSIIDEGNKEDPANYVLENYFGMENHFGLENPLVGSVVFSQKDLSEIQEDKYYDLLGIRILIIYEETIEFNSINIELEDLKYDKAFSVESAMKKISLYSNSTEEALKLIIIDSSIAIIEAFTINEKLKNNMQSNVLPKIPIIVIIENVDEYTKNQYKEIGIDKFLQKPVKKDHILDAIRNL